MAEEMVRFGLFGAGKKEARQRQHHGGEDEQVGKVGMDDDCHRENGVRSLETSEDCAKVSRLSRLGNGPC